jgi:hypothetical protein
MSKRKILLGSLVATAAAAMIGGGLATAIPAMASATAVPLNTTCTAATQGSIPQTVRNLDVPAGETCKLGWIHATGNVTVEGTLQIAAGQIDHNMVVTGGSFDFFNDPTVINGDLVVSGSPGFWQGNAGGDNTFHQYNSPSATGLSATNVKGSFYYLNSDGHLYIGSPLTVGHDFVEVGGSPYAPNDLSGMTVHGKKLIK